ncbi:hypothetical protein LCGC14_1416690 [marine sediment metagenome]|uniref:Uncharacterized protein n=1 Tax=marine sediment metagenome TaxID=412755 RepID=A0A0F9JT24_9ZZZZ
MATKLIQVFPRQLMFSPYAWSKIQYFFSIAGKLEMSGFGVSDADLPLYVKDFQSVDQLSDGTNTELDDMGFNKYVGEMVRKKIPPAGCTRLWVHSHPFADSPHPSGQDNKTFKSKICHDWTVEWACMIIIGKKEAYVELFTQISQFHGYLRTQIPAVVDWMGDFWEKNDEAWEKEYKAHVVEAPEPVIEVADKRFSTDKDASPGLFNFTEEEEHSWTKEWTLFPNTMLNLRQWVLGRAEGFTVNELLDWGGMCVFDTPENLRRTANYEGNKHVEQYKKAEARRRKKEAKNDKKSKKGKKDKSN